MFSISNIISYLFNDNIEFTVNSSELIDKGDYAYKDIIISLKDRNLQILCRFFDNFENIEYYIKYVEDCYKFFTLQEFHSYILKTKT